MCRLAIFFLFNPWIRDSTEEINFAYLLLGCSAKVSLMLNYGNRFRYTYERYYDLASFWSLYTCGHVSGVFVHIPPFFKENNLLLFE